MQELLYAIALAAMTVIGRTEHVSPNVDLAQGIASAVAEDPLPPITGSRIGDVVLHSSWSFQESRWKACAEGDHGQSLGYYQLQRVNRSVACSPTIAPIEWMARARASILSCQTHAVPPDEWLAELASGRCDRGRMLVRGRIRSARTLAATLALTFDDLETQDTVEDLTPSE